MKTLEPGTLALAISKSQNAKIGDAATTYAAQGSCPSECVFFDGGGCYAEQGALGKFVTGPLNASSELAASKTPEDIAIHEAQAIDDMEVVPGRPLRLHTVGDCKTDAAAEILSAAARRYIERGGGPVWTYTHGWRTVARESWGIVSVLASCETAQEAGLARSRGYAPSMVVERFESWKLYELAAQPAPETPHRGASSEWNGVTGQRPGSADAPVTSVRILPCPQQTSGVHCSDCRLCFNDEGLLERGTVIGFALHGTPFTLRQATKALRDPDDPERRLTSRVLIPRFVDSFKETHEREPTVKEIATALDLNPSSVSEMQRSLRGEAPRRRYRRRVSA